MLFPARTRWPYAACFGLLVALSSLSSSTRAEPKRDPAAAELLFDRGKELLKEGNWPAACAKFEASMELDPAVGTLLKIAKCHEHEGKLARAWADYRAAIDLNRTRPGQTRERREELHDFATRAIEALEPRVPRLSVRVREKPRGLRITRDGHELPDAAIGEALPVDPGSIEIVAEAPDHVTVRRSVVVSERQRAIVDIALERVGASPGPRADTSSSIAPPPIRDSPPHPRRVAGVVLGAAGVVGLGVALGFAVDTLNKVGASYAYCTDDNRCYQPGLRLRDAARRSQTAGLVSLGAGVALAATGIALFATAPRAPTPARVPIALQFAPSGATVVGLW